MKLCNSPSMRFELLFNVYLSAFKPPYRYSDRTGDCKFHTKSACLHPLIKKPCILVLQRSPIYVPVTEGPIISLFHCGSTILYEEAMS